MTRLTGTIFALLALSLTACAANELTVDPGSASMLVVQNNWGTLTLTDDSTGDVHVTWTVEGEGGVDVTGVASASTVTISGNSGGDDASINLVVSVPEGMNYNLQSAFGNLTVSTGLVSGQTLTAQTSEGDLDTQFPLDAGFTLSADCAGGVVEIDDFDFVGTNMGGVAAGTVGDAGATVTLAVDLGDIGLSAR